MYHSLMIQIRKGAKRLCSVALCALLLLSAWVFVAPDSLPQASAVTATFSSYKVTYQFKCTDDLDDNNAHFVVWANGYKNYGASASIDDIGSATYGTKDKKTWDNQSISLGTAVPSGVEVNFYRTDATVSRSGAFEVNSIEFWGVKSDGTTVKLGSQANFSGSKDATNFNVWFGNQDVLSRPTISATISKTSDTFEIPHDANITTTFTSYVSDNRSCTKLPIPGNSSAGSFTQTVTDSNNPATGVTATYTNGNDYVTSTVTIPTSAHNGGVSSRTVKVTAKYTSGNRESSKTYTMTLKDYAKIQFDKNGGSSINVTDPYYTYDKLVPAGSYPTSGKYLGHEFIGMYSPAKNISYATEKPVAGETSGYTGQLTDTKETANDTTYYAAWWAKNVNVKYLNNDGSILKESDYGKYGKRPSDYTATAKPADPTFVTTPGVSGTYTYEFVRWEVVSAKQYTMDGDGVQTQIDYSSIVGQPYSNTDTPPILKGDTVYQAVYRIAGTNTYTVNYYDGSSTAVKSDTWHYRDTATEYTRTKAADNTFTYTFKGWATRSNASDNQYIYIQGDNGPVFDDGHSHEIITDFTVYNNMNLVAVYEKTYKIYTVNFVYTDRTENPDGTYSYALAQNHPVDLHYGDSITVPVYEQDFFDYTGKVEGQANNRLGYTYKFLRWNETPALNITESVTYTALYSEEAAEYEIKFVDYDGTVLNEGNITFAHDTDITDVEAAAFAALDGKTYRDDDYEYAFAGWDKPVQMIANDFATYNAVYTRNPLYTVTYINEGSEVATWKGVAGETIPVLPMVPTTDPETGNLIQVELATPEKAGDNYAEAYLFAGWAAEAYDAKNPAEILVKADGTSAYGMPAANTTLYAQYTCDPTIYTVDFVYGAPDEDGVMPSHPQTLTYDDPVAIPSDEDVARPNDNKYTYEFRGWDSTVSETCKGNATYTALYRMGYVYYTVAWYQPDLTSTQQTMTVGEDTWVYYAPSTEKVRPDETYIYNALISAPYQEANAPASADPNYEYVLAGWLYKGTTDVLARADRVTTVNHMSTTDLPENRAGKIELIPVFVLKANVKTVTFLDEDGSLLGMQKVPYGTLLKDVNVGTLPAKSATETDHYTLDGWLLKTGDTFAEETLDAETYAIEVNITVKAKFSAKPHEYELVATTTAPTFFAEGEGELKCLACNKEGTVVLPKLADTVAPTGRVMVKSNKWLTIADQQDAVLTAAQSIFIVNTADTATATTYYLNKATKEIVNELPEGADEDAFQTLAYNDGGAGSQVGDIYLYATKGDPVDPEDVADDDWYRCFNYAEYHEQNPDATEANFSATVGDIAREIAVEDGETFIIYVKIVDRGDPANAAYISTAPLTYDGTPPVITITSTDGKDTVKHCVDATIEVDEGSWFFITKNGEELTTVSRTLTEKGEYTVFAYDEAGNESRKVVEIIGNHSPKTIVTAATCTEGGEQYDVCRTCGMTISDVTETDALGHSLKYRVKQPTCTEDGSVTVTCRRCGEAINDLVDGYTAENGVYTGQILAQLADPDTEDGTYERLIATGAHTWGDWEVDTPATCVEVGRKVRYCTKCGEEDTAELPIDENAHRWSASVYTTPATCTEPGETYRICRYNDAHKQHVADIEPTGHIGADEWVRTQEPTCTEAGTEVQYCKYHGLVNGEVVASTVVVDTREVPALGHDFTVFMSTVPPRWDGATPVQGYDIYKCSRCDETTHLNFKDPEDNVTVTFVVNGVVGEPVETAKGSTLSTVVKPDTTKASDNTYRYTFAGWKKAVKNGDVWEATGDVLKDTFAITENVTLIATYDTHYINYTVTFLKDNGSEYKVKGYTHWGDTVTVDDPTKDEDDTATYTFQGWKAAVQNGETWEATGDFVDPIICSGNATYIAVFEATAKTYTVIWADRAGTSYNVVKMLENVAGGSDVSDQAPALPASTKTADSNGHWIVTGWDQSPTNVTSNIVIRPVLVQEAHSYAITNTPADCTNPAKTTYTCACGYTYFIANGRPNGHTWTVLERVNPTATADGYELRECSVCHVQDRVVLDKTGMINLTIVVKDSNGNPVSGANVRVYDGNTLVSSGVTDGSGKAVVQVPEAKTYRIEIDGNGINGASGTITVDQNGRITGGAVPTVTRPGSGSHGCDCTCHKSGFWPTIFRFFHKIIKMITGEFRCCPDANY